MVSKKTKALLAGLGIATIAGTFSGNEGGFTPFYNKKVGTSYGINIGCYNRFESGSEFYGINIGLGNCNKGGTINGLNLSIINLSEDEGAKINGLEVSLVNSDSIYRQDKPSIVNGGQIGFVNRVRAGKCFQLGVYNDIEMPNGKHKRSFLINYNFKGKSRR